ncbi:pectinesterase [Salvia divinorum]|uniref:Pectinesterase n=1 Tax=Salvia divinorum TaxID=28513 RepID=A0ABD1FJ09_SALDI
MTNHIFLLPLLLISTHFGATIFAFYTPASAPIDTKAPASAPIGLEAPASAPIVTKAPASAPIDTKALASAPIAPEAPANAPIAPEAPASAPIDTEAPASGPIAPEAQASAPIDTKAPTSAPIGPKAPASAPIDTKAPSSAPIGPKAPASAPIDTKAPAKAPIVPKAPASAPNGPKAQELFDSSLRETLAQAQNAHQLISTMDPSSFDFQARTAWDDCVYLYQDTIDLLGRSIASKDNQHDVQTWLSASLANEQTCQDGFLDLGLPSLSSQSPSFNLANANFTESISNALVISKVISSPCFLAERNKNGDRKLLQFSGELERHVDIVVAQDGSGHYETINEGLAAAAHAAGSGTHGVVILVKKGIYYETVVVDKLLKNLRMIGDGIDETIITGNNNVHNGSSTFRTATVSVRGDGFIAKGITFENTAGPKKQQAVALLSTADNSVFYNCSFKGYQDTLYVHSNRQFYRDCDVYGTVDFIFGHAAAVLQNCNIYLRQPLPKQKNTITAQGRKSASANSGIVIHNSRIKAAPGEAPAKNYLGRPWKKYSRTVFIKCEIDDLIAPEGWLEWKGDFALRTLYYGEYLNSGGGADTTRRVNWPGFRVIGSEDEAAEFSVGNFLAGDSWLPATGVPFNSTL